MAIDPDQDVGAERASSSVDGRRARRDRNRAAVIDELFRLLDTGVGSPSAEAIANGAGVSVSSIFRYFESLDDLQEQTIASHFERFGPLFDIPAIGEGTLDERIDRLIDARLCLYASIAPVARLARARALDQPRLAETLDATRRSLSAQVHAHFETELARRTDGARDDVVDAIDALTSFEAWDLLRSGKGRSDRRIRRSWRRSLACLVD